ncbi:hypothetical protein [Kitasatospora sp. NPDC057223]|uniref:hypothetical protein n=1 Tax=Kitasatospora sp. NPDC057223 TaxID=3346055 RepID=UPI00362EF355
MTTPDPSTTAPLPIPEQRSQSDDDPLQIRFVVPPAFHEIPVLGTEDEVAERLWEVVSEVLAGRPEEDRLLWAGMLIPLIPPMADAGVLYSGICLVDIDGRPSTASVLVSLNPLGDLRYEEALDTTAAQLAEGRPEAEITQVELPAGRAVVMVGTEVTPVTGPTADGEDAALSTSAIQVYLPLPNEREMLSLELSTPCAEDWELYSEVFADIVGSIHVEFAAVEMAVPEPGTEGGVDGDSAARISAAFG